MNKKMHSSKRLSFSVVDFVIILAAVALIVGVIFRYDVVDRLFSKTSLNDAKITFVAEAINEQEAEVFKENTKFYTDGVIFGTLTSVTEPKKALIYREDNNGVLVSYEHESLFDLDGSFTCKVMASENGYLLGGNRYIAAGSTFVLRAGGVAVRITVLSVQELE